MSEKFDQNKYINEFKKLNYKNYSFRFSLKNEKHIIDHLEKQKDKKNYVKALIEADIKRNA